MKMKVLSQLAAAALAAVLPLTASAHKMFLVPSTTVLSDPADAWVTVDAAISNDLFNFNHHAMDLANLVITGPDGRPVKAENRNQGKWRSTFDVQLLQAGTYRIAVENEGLFASYLDGKGERKRWRGSTERLDEIPADAKELVISQVQGSVNTFVTVGRPNDKALRPSGNGLELVPLGSPNDLFAGEATEFRFLVDGKPIKDLEVTVIAAGTRYRDRQDEISMKTDADGRFSVNWPAPGLYWLNAALDGEKPTEARASTRRLNYTATFEVLPP